MTEYTEGQAWLAEKFVAIKQAVDAGMAQMHADLAARKSDPLLGAMLEQLASSLLFYRLRLILSDGGNRVGKGMLNKLTSSEESSVQTDPLDVADLEIERGLDELVASVLKDLEAGLTETVVLWQ